MKVVKASLVVFSLFFWLAACSNSSVDNINSGQARVLPDAESPGAKLLKDKCGKCHGAPNPNVHKADEWPNVVSRMQRHRIMNAYGEIPKPETQILISYLQKYSAQ